MVKKIFWFLTNMGEKRYEVLCVMYHTIFKEVYMIISTANCIVLNLFIVRYTMWHCQYSVKPVPSLPNYVDTQLVQCVLSNLHIS